MSKEEVTWIETTEDIYRGIYGYHKDNLTVFSTFTNTESNERFGSPKLMTEWGFHGADYPLIKSIGTKENNNDDWDFKYFIAHITNQST